MCYKCRENSTMSVGIFSHMACEDFNDYPIRKIKKKVRTEIVESNIIKQVLDYAKVKFNND